MPITKGPMPSEMPFQVKTVEHGGILSGHNAELDAISKCIAANDAATEMGIITRYEVVARATT